MQKFFFCILQNSPSFYCRHIHTFIHPYTYLYASLNIIFLNSAYLYRIVLYIIYIQRQPYSILIHSHPIDAIQVSCYSITTIEKHRKINVLLVKN